MQDIFEKALLKTSDSDDKIWLLSNGTNISINQIGSFAHCDYFDNDEPIFSITLTKKNAKELINNLQKWIDKKL